MAERSVILVDSSVKVSYRPKGQTSVCNQPRLDRESMYITHFFDSFLRQHNFTAQPGGLMRKKSGDLPDLLHSSLALQHAVVAVASMDLDFYKACSVKSLCASRPLPETALRYYHCAVESLRREISQYSDSDVPNGTGNAHLLWGTILLATFELMYDATGSGFLTHFVHGTTILAQQHRPQNLCSVHFERTLYDTVRMFELIRAFVFWEPTFLVRKPWREPLEINFGGGDRKWHPLDGLFELAVDFLGLNARGDPAVYHAELSDLTEIDIETLRHMAEEGVQLRRQLSGWQRMALAWSLNRGDDSSQSVSSAIDAQMQLALVLFHTMSICLGNMYRHSHYDFLGLDVPVLDADTKIAHSRRVLDLVSEALDGTSLAAVLFCWPVQVAALRLSMDAESKQRSMCILDEIGQRGFAVARHFQRVLRDHWEKFDLVGRS